MRSSRSIAVICALTMSRSCSFFSLPVCLEAEAWAESVAFFMKRFSESARLSSSEITLTVRYWAGGAAESSPSTT